MKQIHAQSTILISMKAMKYGGKVFDEVTEKKPLKLTLGQGKMLHYFEQALIGLGENQTAQFKLSPEQAYGKPQEARVFSINRNLFSQDKTLSVGDELEFPQADGKILFARIVGFDEDEVTVDTNHPLAGETLYFKVTVLKIFD